MEAWEDELVALTNWTAEGLHPIPELPFETNQEIESLADDWVRRWLRTEEKIPASLPVQLALFQRCVLALRCMSAAEAVNLPPIEVPPRELLEGLLVDSAARLRDLAWLDRPFLN